MGLTTVPGAGDVRMQVVPAIYNLLKNNTLVEYFSVVKEQGGGVPAVPLGKRESTKAHAKSVFSTEHSRGVILASD